MAGFRATSGGATARFGAAQATIIRDLVGQIAELISDGGQGGSASAGRPADPAGAGTGGGDQGWPDDGPVGPDDLAAMMGLTDTAKLPEDPVLARLLPDASHQDPQASLEFRRIPEH